MNNPINIQEIIQSGMLERYAFGHCSEEEMLFLLPLLQDNAELKAELEKIEQTLFDTAFKYAVEAPSVVKENLFSALPEKSNDIEGKIIRMRRKGIGLKKENARIKFYLYAASIALLISIGVNAILFSSYNGAKEELTSLQSSRKQIASEFAKLRDEHDDLTQQFTLVTNPYVRQVELNAVKENENYNAKVYFNRDNGNVVLNLAGIQPLPPDKQYQLWALVDGKPIDLGVFDGGIRTSILKIMNMVAAPDAFAVTVEPYGGSVNPTLEQMVMLGKVS